MLRNKYPNTQEVEAAARASLGNGRLWTKVPTAAPQAPQRHPGTFVEKAKGAWGDPLPDWIQALAEEADRIKLAGIARKLDYSQAAISTVLSKKYAGDVTRIEGKVRGFLLGAKVMCPVYGEIGRDQCLDLQRCSRRSPPRPAAVVIAPAAASAELRSARTRASRTVHDDGRDQTTASSL